MTRLGEMMERLLGCRWTERSCFPFWDAFWVWFDRRLLSGTVGTGTASGPDFVLRSEPDWDFLRFSLFSWSTGLLIWETGGFGFTFLALFFLAEAATNRFHVRADISTEWRLRLFSVLPLAPSVFSSRIPPFLDVGEIESTVPIFSTVDQHPPALRNALSRLSSRWVPRGGANSESQVHVHLRFAWPLGIQWGKQLLSWSVYRTYAIIDASFSHTRALRHSFCIPLRAQPQTAGAMGRTCNV